MSFIKHKKVELTELFYDLVYVYTISQLMSIIHHAHHHHIHSHSHRFLRGNTDEIVNHFGALL